MNEAEGYEPYDHSSLGGTRVLVVDDDPDMRAFLGHWLREVGCNVDVASDGVEALARSDIARPDVVLTDLVMDEMDGLKLASELHRLSPLLPVIMLSGKAGVAEAMRAAHLGVPF
jgi:two-component system, NtrC family, response regulator GlrR